MLKGGGILFIDIRAINVKVPVCDDEDGHWQDEDPGLQVVTLAKERDDNGDVALDGECHRGVDGTREGHLRDGNKEGSQMVRHVICRQFDCSEYAGIITLLPL